MKTKLLFAFTVSFLSIATFSQKKKQTEQSTGKKQETAVYAEKKGNDYYLVRLEKDKEVPNVYVYSAGNIKPYKTYTDLKNVLMDFPE